MRTVLRLITRLFAALVFLVVLYLIAALGFALFPSPGRAQQAQGEPIVYVCTSLAHADIVMPSRDPLVDWSSVFPAVTPPDLPAEAYLAFGWGDLRFFRETPNWSDVRLSTALSAMAGVNDTAIRAVAVNPPSGDPDCVALRIDATGRRALIDHIHASLKTDGSPRLQPVAQTGLEAYYLAKGQYSPLRTCNQWLADALAAAGLPHARFAPFSFSIAWPLRSQSVP